MSSPDDRGHHSDRRVFVAVLGAAALSVALVIVTVCVVGDRGYLALSRGTPGMATSMTSALVRLTADTASGLCLGGLVTTAFITPRRSRAEIDAHRDHRIVRWSATVWTAAATLLVGVDAADASGQSLSKLLEPGALGYLVQANYVPGAWILAAVVALGIVVATNLTRSWTASVLMAACAAVAVLAPVMVTQVLVGPDHDFGSDAAAFGTPAGAIWLGVSAAFVARFRRGRRPGRTTRWRYRAVALACWAIWASATVVVGSVELAGSAPLGSPTGVLFMVQFALVSSVAAITLLTRAGRRDLRPEDGPWPFVALLSAQLVGVALSVAMSRIPPPVYFVPTSTQQSFLGFDLNVPLTLSNLALAGRPNLLFCALATAASGTYYVAALRLRRRGDRWPTGRSVAWFLGWTIIVATTSAGVGPLSAGSLAVHMGLHMSLNMLGPLLLVLGGPITLFLRATTAHRRADFAGPHEWLATLTHSPLLGSLSNPVYVLVVFVGSYYAIYLTPFYSWAMRLHWAHQAMTLHYVVVGYLFYALVIGVDKPPRPLPHIGKLGLVLAAMPFHAFFGVVVMTSKTILAKKYFDAVEVTWLGSLAHDQYVAGGIAWAAGELPLIVVVLALVTQWARQDARTSKRIDRHQDAGLDDSYDDYNRMLRRLSEQDRTSSGPVAAPSKPILTERTSAPSTSRQELP